ncbi:MAG: hypothetical protein ACFHVJ_13760 [Aestuariibacter sp.]
MDLNSIRKVIVLIVCLISIVACDDRDDSFSQIDSLTLGLSMNGIHEMKKTEENELYVGEKILEVASLEFDPQSLRSGQVNSICELQLKAMEFGLLNSEVYSDAAIKIKEKLRPKIESTEYAYTFFESCQRLYDLEFKNPRQN